MAIETQPDRAQGAGGGQPLAGSGPRPWWRRPAIHTAILGAVIGYVLGHLLGNYLTGATGAATQYPNVALSDSEDWPIVLGYLFAVVGWLAGLGVFNDTLRQMTGRPLNGNGNGHGQPAHETSGLARYFRYSLDHKVVGIQYLVGMIIYFCTAGLFAMAIRT
jgi:cytochrome c oxidase subunit 1